MRSRRPPRARVDHFSLRRELFHSLESLFHMSHLSVMDERLLQECRDLSSVRIWISEQPRNRFTECLWNGREVRAISHSNCQSELVDPEKLARYAAL